MERPGPPQHLGPILEASLVLFRFGGEGTWASPWTMDAPCVQGLMPNSWSLSHPQSLGSFLWLPQQDSFEDGFLIYFFILFFNFTILYWFCHISK